MHEMPPNNAENNEIRVSIDGKDISFDVLEKDGSFKASLQCEISDENILIARTITVVEEAQGQGIGSSLFEEAIQYAQEHNLGFVTDYGISEGAERLIQSLISKGYNFVKNPNAVEKQGAAGKRIVTYDGSPVYTLENS